MKQKIYQALLVVSCQLSEKQGISGRPQGVAPTNHRGQPANGVSRHLEYELPLQIVGDGPCVVPIVKMLLF